MAIKGVGTAGDYYRRENQAIPDLANHTACGWARQTTDTNYRSVIYAVYNDPNFAYCGIQTADGTGGTNAGTTLGVYAAIWVTMGVDLVVDEWFWWALRIVSGNYKAWYSTANSTTFTTLTGASGTYNAGYQLVGLFDNSFSEPHHGDIAAVKIFDGGLTDAQVENEKYTIVPKAMGNILLWNPMIDTDKTLTKKDFTGNGYDWTEVGGGSLVVSDGPPIPWGGRLSLR